jgi:hypothetical protein
MTLACGCAGSRPAAKATRASVTRQATFVETIRPDFARPGYARALVNVPMRWQLATGPFIGFLRRGTVVEGTPLIEGAFAVAEFPGAPTDGVLRERPSQLGVWVAADIATSEIPRELAAKPGAESFYGLYRELSAEPGGPGFAFVKCGRVTVLERRGKSMRVAADYPSGELHGWIEAAAPGERDAGCDYPEGLPRGYARFDGIRTAFEWLEGRGTEIHRRAGAGCESWRFESTSEGKRWVRPQQGATPRAEYSYWHRDGALGLAGPSILTSTGWLGSSGVDGYRIVDMTSEILALRVGYVGADEQPILAYRVAVLERWFTSAEACRAAKLTPPP